jgi:hypothetical protein
MVTIAAERIPARIARPPMPFTSSVDPAEVPTVHATASEFASSASRSTAHGR